MCVKTCLCNSYCVKDIKVTTILGDYLKEQGISQTHVANIIGINRGTLINIIKNPNSVTLANARKIAIALKKSVDELFPNL